MSAANAARQSPQAAEKSSQSATTPNVTAPLSPNVLLQRAQADPSSLTIADVRTLQRAIGNRATGRLLAQRLAVQTKLQLGPANDKYEQEADHTAQQVVRSLSAPAPPVQREEGEEDMVQAKPLAGSISSVQLSRLPAPPGTFVAPKARRQEVQRDELDEELAQAAPNHGLEGGEVEPSVAQSIQRAKGGGSGLDPKTRTEMEGAFGASFGGVRIHTGSASDILNRSLNARAFTSGSDIFFRSGEYNPGSAGGKQLLAHELTHTVQQGAAGVQRDVLQSDTPISSAELGVVQRDIGFEFETTNLMTKKSNTGALPGGGFPNAGAATAVWNAPTTTRVDKGAALLTRADIEVQADDRGANSDLEVVTTHFPLTGPGRASLNNAMGDLTTLVNAQVPFLAAGGGIVPAEALDATANFTTTMHDGMIGGNWSTATTAPQVTVGTRIGNIGDIVRDLHGAPGETLAEKGTRDPGRLRMRRPNPLNVNEPRALGGHEESTTLINGHTLARNAIANYQLAHPLAPAGNELEGLLTIIYTYCEGVQHKNAFLKQHTPLMAKTNLSTIFTTLPANVQTYYSLKPGGISNLESLVATAPGYAIKMGQSLFHGVSGLAEDNMPLGQPQWYHRLTLESWLRGIVLRDRTKGEAFVQFFKDNWGGSTQRPGKDQLTTRSFPGRPRGEEVEGYGALGNRMDTHLGTGDALPVFELRAANRPITFAAAQQWALDLFDYVQSLNNNPGGGYAHMV